MTDQRVIPAPIRKTMRVHASRERAFEVFTAKMGGWWAKQHSVGAKVNESPQADVLIEPRVGGRWYEISENGAEYDWGRVLAWDPPARLVLAWQLTAAFEYDAGFETEVEVTFTQDGDETLVTFEHRNLDRFGDVPELLSGMDAGWGMLLGGFEKAADG